MGTVAATVIGIGIAAGLLVAVVVMLLGSAVDDRRELDRRTVRRFLGDHPAVRRIAEFAPHRAGTALAEGLAIGAIVLVVTSALIGVFVLMIRNEFGLARADTPIAHWAADNATDRGTALMRELSTFGGTAYIVIGAMVITAITLPRDRRWAVPLYVFVTMLGQFLVSNSIKWSVERARPDLANLTGFAGTSFPSGHAVAAAAAWSCVAFLLGRGRSTPVRALLYAAATTIAVVVAGTRVGLGVHWTTDVTIGAVIGWAWFALCTLIFGAGRLRVAEPITIAADVTSERSTRHESSRRVR